MNKTPEPTFGISDDQKFEALKMSYTSHVELLRYMTAMDYQIFGSYITLQLLLGSWLGEHAPETPAARVGIAIVDAALAIVAAALIHNDYMRRKEVIATLGNIATALRFTEPSAYLAGVPINDPATFRPWKYWYWLGILFAFAGILALLFGGFAHTVPGTLKT